MCISFRVYDVIFMIDFQARNAEKAMTTLARFRAAQLAESGRGQQERRPVLASECDDLRKAEKWRSQINREVTQRVAQIQNAGLGEFRVREMNDEINKLLREKGHWEVRIKELGGPDYSKIGPKMLDHEGKEVPGNRGYKYFGVAKDLPGVRELFEQEPPKLPRKTRSELMKDIDADYYGYRDDDDGILVPLEKEYDEIAIKEAYEKFKAKKFVDNINEQREEEDIYAATEEPMSEEDEDDPKLESMQSDVQRFLAHVPIPSREEVEEALVKRKKAELLEQYASEELRLEVEHAKTLILK